MSRPLSTCFSCGEKHYKRHVNFCNNCDAPLDKEKYQEWLKDGKKPMPNGYEKETEKPNKEEKPMEKTTTTSTTTNLRWWIALAIILALGLIAFLYISDRNQQQARTNQLIAEQRDANIQLNERIAEITLPTNPENFSTANTTGAVTEQAYVPHPRLYEETGIEGTKTWRLVVNKDEYLIVGGVSVNGQNDGVYLGYGPGKHTIKVTNGFVSIVDDDWGSEEFNFRVNQAIKYGWAHAVVDRGPIPNK